MGIFQKSILNKHLINLNKSLLEKAYQKFIVNFSHSKIEKIKKLKEEEYQDGFLRDLFVDVLGYRLKPDDNFTLVREFKNQADGKKADGAILKDEKAFAVIELKSTTTKDLKSVTEQAFNYKNNQPSCKYVITSNFQKLRFYVEYANEYEEFNLFNLAKNEIEAEIGYLNLIEKNAKLAMEKAKESAKFSQEASGYSKKVTEYAEKQRLMVNEPKTLYGIDNGGFDVVIGNPPYVDIKALPKNIVTELFKKYKTAENRINLYAVFIEQAHSLVKKGGIVSFINPNSILVNSSYRKIRKLLFDSITKIVKLPDDVFVDAKVETIIFEFRKGSISKNAQVIIYKKQDIIDSIDNTLIQSISKAFWKRKGEQTYNIYVSKFDDSLFSKIEKESSLLSDIADFSLGITPYDKYKGHSKETISTREFHSLTKLDNTYKPLISGSNIIRYHINDEIKDFLKYGKFLGAPRDERFFLNPRIIVRQIVSGNPPRIFAGYTEEALYFTQIGFSIISNSEYSNKYILSILNSKLITYYHKYKFLDLEKNLFQKILIANCKKFPIKQTNNQLPFIEKVNILLQLNKEFQIIKKKFMTIVNSNFDKIKITKKIDSFYDFDFKYFLIELKNKILTPRLENKRNGTIISLQLKKKLIPSKQVLELLITK